MVKVGVHVSIAGSIAKAVERAGLVSCDTFQIFSRNPRGWAWKDLAEEDVQAFRGALKKASIFPPVDHMPYLPNLAGPNPEHYEKSIATLTSELSRCGQLGIPYLVTHLGHHPGMTIGEGRKNVMRAINQALGETPNDVMLLLENTAGEKNGVGNTFEDISAVLDGVVDRRRTGVCFDTCHAFGAGYDLRTDDAIEETTARFDEIIGLGEIRVIHCNDSKGELGSGLDRHEHIGMGSIGEDGFQRILRHEPFSRLPLVCETPVDARRDDAGNIAKVRELAG
ncbi:MAG: deoxyribonuclease IV [Methanomicrobiales archaeon]